MGTTAPVTISSNTLFHFTDRFETLIGILTDEFRPRFCLENLTVLTGVEELPEPMEFAIPMICFCDLPLSQTAQHLSVYGNYGIGLSKDWAQRWGITPVLYTYPGALITQTFRSLVDRANERSADSEIADDLLDSLYDFSCFVKPYEGDFWRRGTVMPNVRFYDEREWRYVPKLPTEFYPYGLKKELFLDPDILKQANDELAIRTALSFEPRDIRYIIVECEDEILPMMERIERIKRKFSYDDVRLLMSRVISAEQIRQDF